MRIAGEGTVNILGVVFDDVTKASARDAIIAHAKDGGTLAAVFTPNSELVERCAEGDGTLTGIINSAELTLPDSVGIMKAARIFGTPLKERVPGVEVGEAVLERAAAFALPVYFLGGRPGVAEAAKRRMEAKYPGLSVVGTADGYFERTPPAIADVIEKIAGSGARILFVCLGAPAQEKFIFENRRALEDAGVRVALGLGGSLDIYAGVSRRAPKLFVSLGLEWLWRLLREPSRIGRMTALPKFYLRCRREAKKQKKRRSA